MVDYYCNGFDTSFQKHEYLRDLLSPHDKSGKQVTRNGLNELVLLAVVEVMPSLARYERFGAYRPENGSGGGYPIISRPHYLRGTCIFETTCQNSCNSNLPRMLRLIMIHNIAY